MIPKIVPLLCLCLLGVFFSKAQLCLTHIDVIDVQNGAIARDKTVCIRGKRIASITDKCPDSLLKNALDCTGKYLIPGLWDMHIHDGRGDSSTRFEYVPLFIANGVTGIRDMWGNPKMLRLKNDIDAGRFAGPRMVIGSPILEGAAKPFWRHSLHVSSETQGRWLVDSLKAAGYDFIKIYSLIPKSVYLAIADECKQKGIPLEGHLPTSVGLEEALDAGQRSFEHNFGINLYLTRRETEKIQWSLHYLDTVKSVADAEFMVHGEPMDIDERDFFLSPDVAAKMMAKRAAVVPTLTEMKGHSMDGGDLSKQIRGLDYLPSDWVDSWMHEPPAFSTKLIRTYGVAARFLINKGILILAGTDVNNPFCVPGFGLQQELCNLRDAGLSNLQVLQTATVNPAKFLYREQELGTVEAGKLADLIVLEDNPLVAIENTQKINAVILNGRYFSKEDIRRMLESQKKR